MQLFKRILAVIVMVISVLMLVASLTGIVGAWIVRPQLTSDLVAMATEAEARVTIVMQGLDRIDAALTGAREQVVGVEQDLQTFGADVEQNKPLFTAISDRLGIDLVPLIDSAREIMTSSREAVVAVNSSIEAINAFPFVSIPIPELERIEKLSQDLEDLGTQVQDLRTTFDLRRSEIIQGTVLIITTPTSQIIDTLDEIQTSVSSYSQQVGTLQERLSNFNSAVGRWLTWVAVLVSLILLWSALSQVGLLVLGWRFFSGQDLLAQGPQETPVDLGATDPVHDIVNKS